MATMVAAPTFAIVKTANISASVHVVGKVMAIRLANQKLEESGQLVELNSWQSTSTNAFSTIKGSKVKNTARNNVIEAFNMEFLND
jgi:hypothetical protein